MPAYDATHFNPPAPLAQVTLRNPSTGVTVPDVVLLVDSRAEVTLLPRRAVEGFGISLATGRGYEIAGFDGTKSLVPAVHLDMLRSASSEASTWSSTRSVACAAGTSSVILRCCSMADASDGTGTRHSLSGRMPKRFDRSARSTAAFGVTKRVGLSACA